MMNLLLVPIALFATVLGLTILVTRFEKRMVWPYSDPEPECQTADVTGYGGKMVTQALEHGFVRMGWVRDLKGPLYKASYAMLISPDRGTIGIVGIGTIVGIRVETTWLTTTLADRLHWVTATDQPSGVEPDVTGLGEVNLFAGADFGALWEKHQGALGDKEVCRMREAHPLGDFSNIRRERYEWLSRCGVVRFTDISNTSWRYTLRGAIGVSLKRQVSVLRAMLFGNKARPG